MNLTPLGPNRTQVEVRPGVFVLFSYSTPVAVRDNQAGEYFKTEKYWSRTTNKHLRQWFPETDLNIIERPQAWFDTFVQEVRG